MRRPHAVLLAATLLVACNALTGADHLTVGSTGAGGAGGEGTVSSTSASVGSGGSPGPALAAAAGVTITQVALYQGVKRALMGGDPSPAGITVPVVAGRDALVRVFVTTDASYDGGPVTARLHVGGGAPIEVTAPVTASAEDSLASTVNLDVPGARLAPGVDWYVELLQPAHGAADNPAARYPASGDTPLDVQPDGASLKVVLVPVQYDADGSHRLPDTSPEKIQGYRDWLFARYPVQAIDLTVHDPWPYGSAVYAFGLGWGGLLDAVTQLRIDEGAAPDVYYFGIFQPAATFDDYCVTSCTTGLANVGAPDDEYAKAGIGLGYPGEDALGTAVHEIGHTQGRTHAPCGGAKGVDPDFPYTAAGIGVWGYDLVQHTLVSPADGKDMMGYCDPYWISDYTFLGIFERMKTVNKAHHPKAPAAPRSLWARARLEMDGSLTRLAPVSLARPPVGQPTPVTVRRAGGAVVVGGQFFPYDHLAGGVLLWPAGGAPDAGVTVTIDGAARSLSR